MKVKIKLIQLGHFPHSFDKSRVEKWESELFEIIEKCKEEIIVGNFDEEGGVFTDSNMENLLPKKNEEDILIAFTNVLLESKHFVRRLENNRIVVSYSSIQKILKQNNVPLENLLLRLLYSASFAFKINRGQIPSTSIQNILPKLAHNETKGCIFDNNPISTDIIYSTYKPQLCSSCLYNLTHESNVNNRVSVNLIKKVQTELKKIDKGLYYKITTFFKEKPIYSIIISSIFAIFLGVIGSIIATIIYEKIK